MEFEARQARASDAVHEVGGHVGDDEIVRGDGDIHPFDFGFVQFRPECPFRRGVRVHPWPYAAAGRDGAICPRGIQDVQILSRRRRQGKNFARSLKDITDMIEHAGPKDKNAADLVIQEITRL